MRLPKASSCLLLFLVFGVINCGRPRFVYEVEPGFNAHAYRTVAPDPRRDRIIIREGMRPLNPEFHLKAALAELEAHHYQRAIPEEADLWMAVYVLIPGQPEGSARANQRTGSSEGRHTGGRGGRGGSGQGSPPPAGHEEKARGGFIIIVQLEDRKTGRPVWQGEANVDSNAKDADGSALGIDSSLRQLLQPLPARP